MARWVVAGGVGAVVGPLLLAVATQVGLGWRGLFVAFAFSTLLLVVVVRRTPDGGVDSERPRVRDALRAMVRREVCAGCCSLELADLLLDVFAAFLALYLVDDVGASVTAGGLAVAVWTGFGLLGSAAMIPLLRRVDGLRYLRRSAVAAARSSSAFLIVPGVGREARARRGARARQRRLVPGAASAALRRARRLEQPRAHGRAPLPARRGAAARDRGAGGAVRPRLALWPLFSRLPLCSRSCLGGRAPPRLSACSVRELRPREPGGSPFL